MPSPGPSNLHLEAGALSPEALIADIADGFYVTDLIGMGVNMVTGDYSRGASGFWIENGKRTFAGERGHHRRDICSTSSARSRRPTISNSATAPMRRPCGWRASPLPASNSAALAAPLEAVMREAGELARVTARGPFKRWTKGDDNSPVSDGDIAVNNLLRARLGALAPQAGWLSEETEDDLPGRDGRATWIVDPIDGTRAYISGRADWTISVALVEHGRPQLAALYAPVTDEMFLAMRGAGATLNGAAHRGERRRQPCRRQARRTQTLSRPARRLDAGHPCPAQGAFAGAAADARRAWRARCRLRLARQPRLGPCGGRPFGARSRRRDDRFRRPAAELSIGRKPCMAR